MNEVVRTYINTLTAPQLVELIKAAGHTSPIDETDTSMLRGYVLAMVAQGSIEITEDVNPFTGRHVDVIRAEHDYAVARSADAKSKPTVKKYEELARQRRAEFMLVPSVAVAEQEERESYNEEHLGRALRDMVADAQATRDELAKRLSLGNSEALSAIEWLAGRAATIKVGLLAERALALHAERAEAGQPITFRAAAEHFADFERDALLRDAYRGASTSAFHNALEADYRKAARDFADYVRRGW